MHIAILIGIYAPFCIVTAGVFAIELFRGYKRQEDYLFMLLCFCALGWYVVSIWGLLTESVETAEAMVNAMLIFVALIAPTLLLFIVKFYKYELPIKLPKYSVLFLYLVPVITAAMVITSGQHSLLNTRLEILSLSPVREIEVVWGPWFWVHTGYSYVLSMIIIALIVYQHVRASRFYRLPSTMMAIGVSITLVGNLVTLLQVIPPVIEPTLISMSLSIIFFSLAIFNNNNSKFVRFSKSHIYHYLAEYILVLDENNQVIDYNRAAAEWFGSLGISLSATNLESVTEGLLQNGEIICNDASQGDNGVDIRIQHSMFTKVLNQRIYQMKDARSESIGKIVVFSDVTQNRMLIERLETKAGMDSLTGLANHMAYVGAKERLDTPEHLPVSTVMCDANRLKSINDTLGHTYGDVLLQTVATAFERACPKDGFVARIGGDEFIFLLPGCEPEVADTLVEGLRREFREITGLPFPVSVAFGVATKHSVDQSLDSLIALADERMYEDKRKSRAQQPPIMVRNA